MSAATSATGFGARFEVTSDVIAPIWQRTVNSQESSPTAASPPGARRAWPSPPSAKGSPLRKAGHLFHQTLQRSFMSGSSSVPLLSVDPSKLGSTSISSMEFQSTGSQLWYPLCRRWRETKDGAPTAEWRRNTDDFSAFVGGNIPNWGKGRQLRTTEALGHDLTWNWNRMRRQVFDPKMEEFASQESWSAPAFRKADKSLSLMPSSCFGGAKQRQRQAPGSFQFFRDVRPPFSILEVRRVQDDDFEGRVSGELHEVVWECALERSVECSWGMNEDGWPYNNRARGTAVVRIPGGYPADAPLKVIHWGEPALPQKERTGELALKKSGFAERDQQRGWGAPLARELGKDPYVLPFVDMKVRPHVLQSIKDPRLPARRASLLAPQRSLPTLARVESANRSSQQMMTNSGENATVSGTESRQKKRQMQYLTAAAGFVRFQG